MSVTTTKITGVLMVGVGGQGIILSSNIHMMDAMNLLAAIHVSYELSKLERTVTDLEARLDLIEHGKPRRTPGPDDGRTAYARSTGRPPAWD